MSEDSTRINFTISNKANKQDLSELVDKYSKDSECSNTNILYREDECEVYFEFFVFSEDEIEKFISDLTAIGAGDVIFRTWFDTPGVELFHLVIEGKLLEFNDYLEIEEHRKAISQKSLTIFEYNKCTNNKTALVRLKVKGKKKQKRIIEIFTSINNQFSCEGNDGFRAKFQELFDYEDSENRIRWCAHKFFTNNWNVGPENLISGFKFITAIDSFVYIGFDLDGLDLWSVSDYNGMRKGILTLMEVLNAADGVDKVWVKFRMNTNSIQELYSYYPGMGDDSSTIYYVDYSSDHEWPNVNSKYLLSQNKRYIIL